MLKWGFSVEKLARTNNHANHPPSGRVSDACVCGASAFTSDKQGLSIGMLAIHFPLPTPVSQHQGVLQNMYSERDPADAFSAS